MKAAKLILIASIVSLAIPAWAGNSSLPCGGSPINVVKANDADLVNRLLGDRGDTRTRVRTSTVGRGGNG